MFDKILRYRWLAAGVAALALAGPGVALARTTGPIAWHNCATGPGDALGTALDHEHAQCGEVTVPLDYSRPHGRTITLEVSRIRATDPAHRRGALFLNAGGPGVPALEQVVLGEADPALGAEYDLIGMDPRFVGRSTPLSCRWDTDTFLRSAGPDRRGFDESVRLARSLAAGCTRGNRDLLPHASTRNTARDLDAVRAALGERRISYYGVSYGTYLGAVYLQLFGSHADRFVLDSAVDPNKYGPNLLAGSGPALAAALGHWAGWAATQAGQADMLTTVDRIVRAADNRPLRIGPYRVDGHVLPYLLLAGLEQGEAGYPELAAQAQLLDRAAGGATVDPTPAMARLLAGVLTGAGEATDRAGTPILCADRAVPAGPATYYRDIQAHRADEPLFGPLIRNVTPCAFWPTGPAEPPTTIHTGAPALLVGADGDPITPYPGQQEMHRALTGSRTVTLRGAFRHSVYLSDPCVDGAIDGYLLGGPLPAGDTTCTAPS